MKENARMMGKNIVRSLHGYYQKVKQSIAFYPVFIAIGFLLLSWLMITVDFSPWGKHFKENLPWLSLRDASTARVIISTIVAGILSVTVFSFSMVMIVLNQAASQMSNRVLGSMIENRFQQIILGCYIGTIVYALFLLSTVRDIHTGIYVPAISIYLLILLTVVDIFLFIYFLDYVTQSVKYGTIIHRLERKTLMQMEKKYKEGGDIEVSPPDEDAPCIVTPQSGYFQGFNREGLLKVAGKYDVCIEFLPIPGAHLIKGAPFLLVRGGHNLKSLAKDIYLEIDFFNGQNIDSNPDFGFLHLAEIAIRALSPGINDPGTAVISLQALGALFAYRLQHYPSTIVNDSQGTTRIIAAVRTFPELFNHCMRPIWKYGRNDQYVTQAFTQIIRQLRYLDTQQRYIATFTEFQKE